MFAIMNLMNIEPITPPPTPPKPLPMPETPAEPSRLAKPGFNLKHWVAGHKVWTGVIAGGVVVVLAAGGVFAYIKLHHKAQVVVAPAPVAKPAPVPPKPILSPLTGLPVTAAVLAQPVFGVVIENSPEARPQSGLSQAGVVYETLAEGGITRFLAIFLDQQPANLGPVRSLRPYFIDWAQEYSNPPVAHAGGSSAALGEVAALGFKSMNGLIYGANFHRTSDRSAPHNLYTSTSSLIGLMQRLNYTTAASFTPWAYKQDSPEAAPSHPTISLSLSFPLYAPKYQFNAACDCYNRFLAGTSHIDRNTGAQIQVKNVVAIIMQTSYDSTGHALDTTIGSGKAYVFVDGGATIGTWRKDARTSRIQFLDPAGNPIPLNAGNTWIEVIPQTGSVSY